MPGKSLKVAYTLSNKSNLGIKNSALAITLPGDVSYVSSGSKPMGFSGTLSGSNVVWANAGPVNAGKSKTYTAATTVRHLNFFMSTFARACVFTCFSSSMIPRM